MALPRCEVGLDPVPGRSGTLPPNIANKALRAGMIERHAVRGAGAAVVGDQQHAMAAAFQFRRERVGRDHVAAGPSGSECEIHAVRLSPLHFTT